MASTNVKRWLSWVALLAATAIVPACDAAGAGNAKNPGASGSLWVTTTATTGGTFGSTPVTLVWRDVNLGPIAGGYPLGGDMTFETAGAIDESKAPFPPNPFVGNTDPVSTSTAQSATEEAALETQAQSAYSTWVGTLQGQGGNVGGGLAGGVVGAGGVGGANIPPFTPIAKMRLEPRAECKHRTIHVPTEGAPNSLLWRLVKCGVNPALQAPYSSGPVAATNAVAAYNMFAAAALTRIMATQGSYGYYGGGYWTAAGVKYYCLAIVNMPLGQIP